MEYFEYKYNGKGTTVGEFLSPEKGTGELTVSNLNAYDFLNYSGEDDLTNSTRITNKYSVLEFKEYSTLIATNSDDIPIMTGTTLLIPKDNTVIEDLLLYSEDQFLEQGDFFPYFGDYEDLLKDDEYIRSNALKIDGEGIDINMLNENIQVWIWVRAINKIVNVTPFANFVRTTKGDVGSFSFSLNPIVDLEDVMYAGDDIIHYTNINKSLGFFEKNLQKNDVVFIRFEQLERDKIGDTLLPKNSLYIESFNLKPAKERVWDMIGLIDAVTTSYTASSTDKVVSVSGRDFMKLFTEDGSYFLPLKYIEGKDNEDKFVWGGNENDDWFKRNFIDGNLDYFFTYEMKGIAESLQFIINHLCNLGVTPDNLWSAYGDDITKTYEIPDDPQNVIQTKNVRGVWQIIKLAIDDVITSRVVTGEALINPNGTIFDLFNSFCQDPFVEFWGDTVTDTFDLIVRQPPFTKRAIQEVVSNNLYIEIEDGDLLGYNLSEDTTYYTHYQIEPKNQWAGSDQGVFQSIIPIVYLDKYAQTFGNKRNYVEDMYVPRVSVYGEGKDGKVNTFIEGILNDYQFMIETNNYLPFTRRGSITMNGDRRIKKGGFVLLKKTNELLYVNSVSNDFMASRVSVDRTTTIEVSRGMKMNAIMDNRESKFTYFDIVNAELIKNNILAKTQTNEGVEVKEKTNISTDFAINDEAFDYFITKQHFI